jgi:hypothetical protein
MKWKSRNESQERARVLFFKKTYFFLKKKRKEKVRSVQSTQSNTFLKFPKFQTLNISNSQNHHLDPPNPTFPPPFSLLSPLSTTYHTPTTQSQERTTPFSHSTLLSFIIHHL